MPNSEYFDLGAPTKKEDASGSEYFDLTVPKTVDPASYPRPNLAKGPERKPTPLNVGKISGIQGPVAESKQVPRYPQESTGTYGMIPGARLNLKPTEKPGTILSFLEGLSEYTDPTPLVQGAYQLWKDGKFPEMVDLLTGGALSNTPEELQKVYASLGFSVDTKGIHLTGKGPDWFSALNHIAKAIPIFGPMSGGVEEALGEDKYATAAGRAVGTVLMAKAPEAVHEWRRNAKTIDLNSPEGLEAMRKIQDISQKSKDTVINLDSQNKTEVATKAVVAKKVRTPEQIAADKERMAKVRAARGQKKATANAAEGLTTTTEKVYNENATLENPLLEPQQVDQIKRLSAEGKDPGQIAWDLDIHENTVRQTLGLSKAELHISEVDLQTGTPTPEGLTVDNSPFRMVGNDNYASNRSVAQDMGDLRSGQGKDLGSTLWSQINTVNKWLDGDTTIDINKSRDFLSDIAINADEFRNKFGGSEEQFSEWKSLASDAADWARKATESDRAKIERTDEFGLPMSSMVPREGEPMLSGADISAMESHFGKSFLDLTDDQIKNYINEKGHAATQPEPATPVAETPKTKSVVNKPTVESISANDEAARQMELERLISEQSADMADEIVRKVVDKRRKTRSSLYMGLPLDEAASRMKDWYSALRTLAEQKLSNRGSGQQIKNTLRKGTTADEWKNVNLDNLLEDGKSYTKDEVLKLIDENSVELKDVMLSKSHGDIPEEFAKYAREKFGLDEEHIRSEYVDNGRIYHGWRLLTGYDENAGLVKYSTYQEPGGTNYKELFVTAPEKITEQEWTKEFLDAQRKLYDERTSYLPQSERDMNWQDYINGSLSAEEMGIEDFGNQGKFRGWQDGHPDYSDIENPIVRLRMNDRVGPNGEKVLFLEEMQPPRPEEQVKMPEYLQKRWREIGMKRAIKYAIDGGYDRVAWTTGEMQANRYSLDKHIGELQYGKNPDGTYWLSSPGNMEGLDIPSISSDKLGEYVGNELADKIRSGHGRQYDPYPDGNIVGGKPLDPVQHVAHVLKDIDLVTREEGLRTLYDRDLPNVAKKLGGKVENVDLDLGGYGKGYTVSHTPGTEVWNIYKDGNFTASFPSEESAWSALRQYKQYSTVPSISISPLAAKATSGFSMYSGVDPLEAAKVAKVISDTIRDFASVGKKAETYKRPTVGRIAKTLGIDFFRATVDQSELLFANVRDKYPELYEYIISRQRSAANGISYGGRLNDQIIKEVSGGRTNEEVKGINDYSMARRLDTIYGYKPKYTPPDEKWTKEKVRTIVSTFKTILETSPEKAKIIIDNTPALKEEYGITSQKDVRNIVNSTETLFQYQRKIIDDLVEAGIKSKEEGELLKKYDFRKFTSLKVEDLFDSEYSYKLGSETIKATSSGIESLGNGKVGLIETDFRVPLYESVIRTYGSIANQVAKLGWKRLADLHPENTIVQNGSGRPIGWGKISKRTLELNKEKKPIFYNPKVRNKVPELKGVKDSGLYDYYKRNPKSPYFKEGTGMDNPSGWVAMPYYENGVANQLYFNPESMKYLMTRSHDLTKRITTIMRYATLAPVTKSLAVGLSPIWSTLIGLPMDVMHSFWTARTFETVNKVTEQIGNYPIYKTVDGNFKTVYNAWNPTAPFKLGADMGRTFYDVETNGKLTQLYSRYGGSIPFLAMRENRYVKGVRPPGDIAKFLDLVSSHGMKMELWPRVATMDRVIRNEASRIGISYEEALNNKDILYKAVHSARDRMDYNQGGYFIKALDQSGINFLNAGILGTRTFFRQVKDNPADFMLKSTQLAVTATGIIAMAWGLYPQVMKDVPTEGNEKNIVFPFMPGSFSFIDSNGDTRYLYVKLRMDPGAAYLYRLFDGLTRTYMFDKGMIDSEPDYYDLVRQLKQLNPYTINLQPLLQARQDYITNYSWWQSRQMYTQLEGRTMDWPNSKYEGMFDKNVSQAAKTAGKLTGWSPKRLEGAASNVIPANNEFAYLFGKAYEEVFSDVPEELRKKPIIQSLAEIPGINRVIGVTRPNYGLGKYAGQLSDEEELALVIRNGQLDVLADNYLYGGETDQARAAIDDYIYKPENKDYKDTLRDRFKFAERLKDFQVPNRSFWMTLKGMPTQEAKAKFYLKRWNGSNEIEKDQMIEEERQIRRIGGIITEDFNRAKRALEMK